jgi:hypothetical protein
MTQLANPTIPLGLQLMFEMARQAQQQGAMGPPGATDTIGPAPLSDVTLANQAVNAPAGYLDAMLANEGPMLQERWGLYPQTPDEMARSMGANQPPMPPPAPNPIIDQLSQLVAPLPPRQESRESYRHRNFEGYALPQLGPFPAAPAPRQQPTGPPVKMRGSFEVSPGIDKKTDPEAFAHRTDPTTGETVIPLPRNRRTTMHPDALLRLLEQETQGTLPEGEGPLTGDQKARAEKRRAYKEKYDRSPQEIARARWGDDAEAQAGYEAWRDKAKRRSQNRELRIAARKGGPAEYRNTLLDMLEQQTGGGEGDIPSARVLALRHGFDPQQAMFYREHLLDRQEAQRERGLERERRAESDAMRRDQHEWNRKQQQREQELFDFGKKKKLQEDLAAKVDAARKMLTTDEDAPPHDWDVYRYLQKGGETIPDELLRDARRAIVYKVLMKDPTPDTTKDERYGILARKHGLDKSTVDQTIKEILVEGQSIPPRERSFFEKWNDELQRRRSGLVPGPIFPSPLLGPPGEVPNA